MKKKKRYQALCPKGTTISKKVVSQVPRINFDEQSQKSEEYLSQK